MQETLIGYEAPPGGPSYIGQLAEVAVGTFTQIEEIIAPAQAAPGDLVTVEARVRNLHTATIYIATTAHYNGIDILPTEDYAIVDPGATHSFYFSFSMPNNDIKLDVWSFYWIGAEWYQDDYSYIDIALEVVAPPVAGGVTIQLKNPPAGGNYWQLSLFNEVWGDSVIVGYNIPIDQPMTLESLPTGWSFPLYIDILIYESAVSPHNIVYEVQSAYGPDWPNYKDITIGEPGVYEYDVAEVSLWPLAIIGGLGVLGVLGIGAVALATRRE